MSGLARGVCLLGFWVVLMGADPVDLVVGAVTAAAAAWLSLRLLPPPPRRFRLRALPGLAVRFLSQSVLAGIDVARRALAPKLPLRPGWVSYPVRFPRGPLRNTFAALTSLLPGTVPAGEDENALLYHCLDVDQPVAEQLRDEEDVLTRALTGAPR